MATTTLSGQTASNPRSLGMCIEPAVMAGFFVRSKFNCSLRPHHVPPYRLVSCRAALQRIGQGVRHGPGLLK